jgi:hypothetical protein
MTTSYKTATDYVNARAVQPYRDALALIIEDTVNIAHKVGGGYPMSSYIPYRESWTHDDTDRTIDAILAAVTRGEAHND